MSGWPSFVQTVSWHPPILALGEEILLLHKKSHPRIACQQYVLVLAFDFLLLSLMVHSTSAPAVVIDNDHYRKDPVVEGHDDIPDLMPDSLFNPVFPFHVIQRFFLLMPPLSDFSLSVVDIPLV